MLTGVSKNPPHDSRSRIKVGPSKEDSLLRKLRTGSPHFPQKVAVIVSVVFGNEAGKSRMTIFSYRLLLASLHSNCWATPDGAAALWSLAATSHSHSQLCREEDTVRWTTLHLSKTIFTHAWAFPKMCVVNWKSTQVNKEQIKREVKHIHIQLCALENLNEYSLRANYKMLTLKCWVAGRIMGYCTVKMPDSCMLSCCVI